MLVLLVIFLINMSDPDFDAFDSQIVLMLVLFGFSALPFAIIFLLSNRNNKFLELLGSGMFAGFSVGIVLV